MKIQPAVKCLVNAWWLLSWAPHYKINLLCLAFKITRCCFLKDKLNSCNLCAFLCEICSGNFIRLANIANSKSNCLPYSLDIQRIFFLDYLQSKLYIIVHLSRSIQFVAFVAAFAHMQFHLSNIGLLLRNLWTSWSFSYSLFSI